MAGGLELDDLKLFSNPNYSMTLLFYDSKITSEMYMNLLIALIGI